MNTLVYRVDIELETVQLTEISDESLLNVWNKALIGNGYYAYFLTEKEAKIKMKEVLEAKFHAYKQKLEKFDELY